MSGFDDVLSIEVRCRVVRSGSAAIMVVGDASDAWVSVQQARDISPWNVTRVLFGLATYTASWPILIRQLVAERGLKLQTLALFGWIEDNFITEPRAEIFGITPFGEEPVLFIRDFDLDQPPQCCVVFTKPDGQELLLLAGVLWVDTSADERLTLENDEAAIFGLELSLPEPTRALAELLRADVAGGKSLRTALKAARKHVAPDLMTLADGWRVLTRAVPMIRVGTQDASVADVFVVQQLQAPAPKKLPRVSAKPPT